MAIEINYCLLSFALVIAAQNKHLQRLPVCHLGRSKTKNNFDLFTQFFPFFMTSRELMLGFDWLTGCLCPL